IQINRSGVIDHRNESTGQRGLNLEDKKSRLRLKVDFFAVSQVNSYLHFPTLTVQFLIRQLHSYLNQNTEYVPFLLSETCLWPSEQTIYT
ncbi:unnamed protein product, partial [Hymenolepis diminuta]